MEPTASVEKGWDNLAANFIQETCPNFSGQAEMVVANDGSHIENQVVRKVSKELAQIALVGVL